MNAKGKAEKMCREADVRMRVGTAEPARRGKRPLENGDPLVVVLGGRQRSSCQIWR